MTGMGNLCEDPWEAVGSQTQARSWRPGLQWWRHMRVNTWGSDTRSVSTGLQHSINCWVTAGQPRLQGQRRDSEAGRMNADEQAPPMCSQGRQVCPGWVSSSYLLFQRDKELVNILPLSFVGWKQPIRISLPYISVRETEAGGAFRHSCQD